ncbi:MAG: permease [Synergistetes bacterium]|nr:MAG: Uncharacterized protein XD52_0098 [bacterium 42_11]MBC7331207.1 permease [Synergistota bacterium]MDK2871504.1 hypothetical protein [bacterium]
MSKLAKSYPMEIFVTCLALILIFANSDRAVLGISHAVNMYTNLFIVIVSIAFLSGLISEFLPPEVVKRIIGRESGFKGTLIGALFGALMIGPAYVFYPLFKDLVDKGASMRVIATTIGAWAVRLHAIPLAGAFLGYKFVLLFNLLIFIYSLFSGFVVGFFCERDES